MEVPRTAAYHIVADAVGLDLATACLGKRCGNCQGEGLVGFYRLADLPSQSTVLVDEPSEALSYGGAELILALCLTCGLIQNVLFQEELLDYTKPTEESQAFSSVFAEYASALADGLIERHDLIGGSVLEVGSGKGEFLALLAQRGLERAVGIDPGFLPARGPAGDLIEFRREFFGAGHVEETADLIVARHLLEHLPNVGEFLGWLAESASHTMGSAIFIEVPDTMRILKEGAFWDVYYEHCSYFTAGSLAVALEMAGLRVESVELAFADQYLLATARPAEVRQEVIERPLREIDELARLVSSFALSVVRSIDDWRARINDVRQAGGRVAVWGASSKAIAFLVATGATDVTVVDINPYKQAKFLPGLALEVVEPNRLIDEPPDLVIPMNPIYKEEISADLISLGIAAEVVPL